MIMLVFLPNFMIFSIFIYLKEKINYVFVFNFTNVLSKN